MSLKTLIYAEVRNGKLKSTAGEAITAARKAGATSIDAVLLGQHSGNIWRRKSLLS